MEVGFVLLFNSWLFSARFRLVGSLTKFLFMKSFYLIWLIIIIPSFSIAQDASKFNLDSAANELYVESMGKYNGLYNGIRYVVFPYPLEGHAFWRTPGASIGDIVYDGLSYKNVRLLYELISDAVVINMDTEYVQLHGDLVNKFSILGHLFINISKDSADTFSLSPGFYDLLYNGTKIKVLGKYSKNIQEEDIMNEKKHVVHTKDKYYMKIGGKYEAVDNEHSVIRLFDNEEVTQFIKKNGINFKSNKDSALVNIAAYYEQLKH